MVYGHIQLMQDGRILTIDQSVEVSVLKWKHLEFMFECFEFCEIEVLSIILEIEIEELTEIFYKIESWYDLIFKFGFLIKNEETNHVQRASKNISRRITKKRKKKKKT